MIKDAHISECRNYRYSLSRIWNDSKPTILFIGLNPSIADDREDDPTLKKCINYAKSWGFGGLKMANLFAYRATLPSDLKLAKDPIGIENDGILKKMIESVEIVVVAWGNDGSFLDRDKEVLKLVKNPMCLNINKSGKPSHPLYQKSNIITKPLFTHN